jgi:hypothetical protein
MIDELDNNGDHDHDTEEAYELELSTQSQIFLDMRQQNLDLLELAAKVAGFTGDHKSLSDEEVHPALKRIWQLYSEFYTWIDPEDPEGDEEDEEE